MYRFARRYIGTPQIDDLRVFQRTVKPNRSKLPFGETVNLNAPKLRIRVLKFTLSPHSYKLTFCETRKFRHPKIKNRTDLSAFGYSIKPIEGNLLIFPSAITSHPEKINSSIISLILPLSI